MTEDPQYSEHIRTPDQRLRVFVSSTLGELADERAAVERAITTLRLIPVMFELGARPHPPQELYRAYLAQSDIFIGLYWQRYGWVGPGMQISGLEDELQLSGSLPRLLYVKTPAPERESALAAMLEGLQTEATASYRSFRTPRELGRLVRDDLAVLLSERFVRGDVATATDEPRAAAIVTFDQAPSLPGRLNASRAPNFVGRAIEYEQLLSAWNAVDVGGERRAMLLSGEPGIGKTTLAARFAQEVHDHGALVVYGRSDDDLGIPYQPWVEALTQLVARTPDDVLVDHVAEHGGQLARLVPELGRRTTAQITSVEDADSDRLILFGGVVDLLARVSSERPMLLVLDDLHWADHPSVQLLRHVLLAGVPMRIAVLGTFRDSEVDTAHPLTDLLARLHRETGVERIHLRGLVVDELSALLQPFVGHELAAEGVVFRDAVLAETDGNPFFVGEILRHLTETGVIHDDSSEWMGNVDLSAAGLPVSVKEVIGRRLSGLGAEMERMLALAAVIGRDFDVSLLAAVADTDDDTVIDLCDTAVRAAVLQNTDDADRYTFAHALIEHAVYDGLSPARRGRAHRAVAEALERVPVTDRGDRVGELAHHWSMAQPPDVAKATQYAQLAGDRALEQLAPDEALRWYSQALDLVETTPDTDRRQHTEILIGLGEAQRQCGMAEHRASLLRGAWEADDIDAVDLLVRAALANSRGWESVVGEVDAERIAVIDRALARLDDPGSAERARLLALATVERLYDADVDLAHRMDMGREAVATARRSGDDMALAFVLHVVSQATRAPQTLEQRVAWVEESCALADRVGNLWMQLTARAERMLTAMERGDLATLRAEIEFARQVYPRHPDPQSRWANTFQDVWCAVLAGDLGRAESLNDVALELGTASGQPDALTIYSGQLANIRYLQGRLDELVPLIEQAVVDAPGLAAYRAVLAMACGRSGQMQRTTELLDEAVAGGLAMPVDNAWTTAYAAWADAAVQVGHRAAAELLRDRLAPFHDHIVTTHVTFEPAVAHYLGRLDHLLGRFDDADAWFTEAMTLHERLESPVFIAHTQAAWAALLADRDIGDDHRRAVEMAETALEASTAGGYGYVVSDAAAVVEQLRKSSR
jgi:hypothetical protein